MFPELNALSRGEKIYILKELDSLFSNLYELVDCKWLSSPNSVYRAENKLHQLRAAAMIGWQIPPTIVTSSINSIKNFYQQHNQDIIIKPLANTIIDQGQTSEFIFTNKVTDQIIQQIEDFDMTPSIFQKNINKQYELRVTVVGNDVFSASVDSQSDETTEQDWRRKKLQFKTAELPTQIQNLCLKLVKNLGLHFGAIDLIRTPEGEYVFLEINPNGQWVWIENQTGLNISDSVIEFLNS
jgi:glutathione synthase/RimK-type ligase-like ATP-grasp enzyme